MNGKKGRKVIAEFSIHPIGVGTSLSSYVRTAVEELKGARGLRLLVTPMGTVMEAEKLSQILTAVEAANERLFKEGARRTSFTLRVDDRRDKERLMEEKVAAVS